MSTVTALDRPTYCHGRSGLCLLHPADGDVVFIAAAAGVPGIDVGALTLVQPRPALYGGTSLGPDLEDLPCGLL